MRRIVDQWVVLLFFCVTLTLTACSGSNEDPTAAEAEDSNTYNISFSTSSPDLSSDDDSFTVTITVKDENNVPAASVETAISLSDDDGADGANTLTVSDTATDANGQIIATISTSDDTVRTITLNAVAGDSTESFDITVTEEVPSYSIAISSDSPTLASGDESMTVTVTVKDANNVPTADVETAVSIEDPDGDEDATTLSVSSVTTDASGQVVATVTTTDATERTITLSVEVGNATKTFDIVVVSAQATLEIFTDKTQLASTVTGTNQVTVFAIVKDSDNVVVAGEEINFSSDGGSLTVGKVLTDANGQASTVLTARDITLRDLTVTASTDTLADEVVIPITGTILNVSTNTSSIAIGTPAAINITLVDSTGKGIANETLTITSANNNILSVASTAVVTETSTLSVTTDANGTAAAYLQGTTVGTDTISVKGLVYDGSPTVSKSLSVVVTNETFSLTQKNPTSGSIPLSSFGTVQLLSKSQGIAQESQSVAFSITRGYFTDSAGVKDNDGTPGVETYTTAITENPINTVTPAGAITLYVRSDDAGPAEITATASNGTTTTLNVNFVADVPASIVLSATPDSVGPGETAVISALVRDAAQNVVAEYPVTFQLQDPSGGSISVANIKTNSSGIASTTFTANISSSADGVTITGSVTGTAGTFTDPVTVTVGDKPMQIKAGTSNKVIVDAADDFVLVMRYKALVTDVQGNAVKGAQLTASATPVLPSDGGGFAFRKGRYVEIDKNGMTNGNPTNATAYSSDDFKQWVRREVFGDLNEFDTVGGLTVAEDVTALDLDGYFLPTECDSEDYLASGTGNGNSILDDDEDANGDGELTPGNVAVVKAIALTDDNGYTNVDLQYAREFGGWVTMKLVISASNITGSESKTSLIVPLDTLNTDLQDADLSPPGAVSPFGENVDCNSPD